MNSCDCVDLRVRCLCVVQVWCDDPQICVGGVEFVTDIVGYFGVHIDLESVCELFGALAALGRARFGRSQRKKSVKNGIIPTTSRPPPDLQAPKEICIFVDG